MGVTHEDDLTWWLWIILFHVQFSHMWNKWNPPLFKVPRAFFCFVVYSYEILVCKGV